MVLIFLPFILIALAAIDRAFRPSVDFPLGINLLASIVATSFGAAAGFATSSPTAGVAVGVLVLMCGRLVLFWEVFAPGSRPTLAHLVGGAVVMMIHGVASLIELPVNVPAGVGFVGMLVWMVLMTGIVVVSVLAHAGKSAPVRGFDVLPPVRVRPDSADASPSVPPAADNTSSGQPDGRG